MNDNDTPMVRMSKDDVNSIITNILMAHVQAMDTAVQRGILNEEDAEIIIDTAHMLAVEKMGGLPRR